MEDLESDHSSVHSRVSNRFRENRSAARRQTSIKVIEDVLSDHSSVKSDHSVTRGRRAGARPNEETVLSDHGSVKSDHSSARGRRADSRPNEEAVLSDHGSVKSQPSSRASERRRKMRDSRETPGGHLSLGDTARSTLKSDTMFGDEPRGSETESVTEEITEEIVSPEPPSLRSTMREEPIQETEGEESESPPIESDSEGLVMARKPSKRKQKAMAKPGDTVTIAISHVSLEEESTAMTNDQIKQLFVEYKFLGIEPQETETPFSLPKPKPYHQIQFNFNKTFHVDLKNNYTRRQYLASMLLPSDPDDGRIRFTLVSEPPEDDQDADCEDVGMAFVNIRDILRNRKDVLEEDVDIMDVADEKTVIGSMNLTVQCLEALESVEKEMQVEGTY